MIMKPYLIIPYFLLSILNISFENMGSRRGKAFTKPFLMPSLIFFFLLNAPQSNYPVVMALICGFLGDVFLMNTKKKTFLIGGIGAFLTGHIFYITAFLERANFHRAVPSWFFLCFLPYLGAGIYLARRLLPHMGSMKIPASIYMGSILAMSFTSLTTMFETSWVSSLTTFAGSLLFIVSDSLLAFDLFKVYKQKNHVKIMATYILAQLLIILGFLIT